jgi:hypothetical protein
VDQQATLSLALAGDETAPGLAVDLDRVDIETALGSGDEESIELVLELEACEVDGGATRRHTLAVGCTPADLEWMLKDAGDSVRLSFDLEALERAIRTPDTEAHGLREKMAVVALVVATTGAAAGGAQAMPVTGGHGGGGTAITSVRDMPADSINASAASTEGAPAPRAYPGAAAAAVAAAASENPGQSSKNPGQRGPYSGGAPFQGPQTTTPVRDLPSDSVRASRAPRAAIVAGSSSSVDSTTAIVVGGIALTLLGAAFGAAVASRRIPTAP